METNNVVSTCYIVAIVSGGGMWTGTTEHFLPSVYLKQPTMPSTHRVYEAATVFAAMEYLRQRGIKEPKLFRANRYPGVLYGTK